jgi:heterodisulfide reductase subunit B
MDFSYFPGCSLRSSSIEYDVSTRAVCRALGITLVELEDWSCCGATAITSVDMTLTLMLSARNLALAEKRKTPLLTPCSACFHNFKEAEHAFKNDREQREKITGVLSALGLRFSGKLQIKHLLDVVVNEVGLNRVSEKVVNPLVGVRVAPYYGCLLVKPPEITGFDDPEKPTLMDKLLKAMGAESIDWDMKTRCCGGPILLTQRRTALELSGKLLLRARELGADCVVLPCPTCHMNLDAMQHHIEAALKIKLNMPVLFFTQLLGLSMGLTPKELGLKRNVVSPKKLLNKVV